MAVVITKRNLLGGSVEVGEINIIDNALLEFGTGNDATIKYDGTDMIINPDLVGTGVLKILQDTFLISVPTLTATDTFATLGVANAFTDTIKITKTGAIPAFHHDRPEVLADNTIISRYDARGVDDASAAKTFSRRQIILESDGAAAEEASYSLQLYLGGVSTEIITINNTADNNFLIHSLGLSIDATQKLFLDGGGDTYIYESVANQQKFYHLSGLT